MRLKLEFLLVAIFAVLILSVSASAQFVFDKPKEKPPLDNPYTINVARADVIKSIQEVIQTCKIEIDPDNTKLEKGLFVTKPWIFTKGLNVKNDLEHVSNLPASDSRNWLKGRYYLEITVLPLDDKRSQIQVAAHIQGQMVDVGMTKWVDSPSNGYIEDESLRGLAGKIIGLDLNPKPNMKRRLMACEY